MIGKVNAMIKLTSHPTGIVKYFSVSAIIAILECEEDEYFRQATVVVLNNGSSHLVKETPDQILNKMKHFGVEVDGKEYYN